MKTNENVFASQTNAERYRREPSWSRYFDSKRLGTSTGTGVSKMLRVFFCWWTPLAPLELPFGSTTTLPLVGTLNVYMPSFKHETSTCEPSDEKEQDVGSWESGYL